MAADEAVEPSDDAVLGESAFAIRCVATNSGPLSERLILGLRRRWVKSLAKTARGDRALDCADDQLAGEAPGV